MQKCALHSGGVNLPKWGWEQGEVTCNPNVDDPNNLWNLETITDDRCMLDMLGLTIIGYIMHAIVVSKDARELPSAWSYSPF